MLSCYLHPQAKPPKPVDRLPDRIKYLVDTLDADRSTVLIPTPILSEFLVKAGSDGPTYLSELTTRRVFRIVPFDTLAAIEAASMHSFAENDGDKKGGSESRWQVVKVDRQFVAISKVCGVECIYSDDGGIKTLAEGCGINVKGAEDLAPPPEEQPKFSFGVESPTTPESSSSETLLPSGQSPDAAQVTTSEPEPGHPSVPRDDQE